jgi:hypothetical protein
MTQPAAPGEETLESILSEELTDFRKEVDALVKHGLSEDEAKGLLDWASELEGKVRAVAAVLADPSPETVSKYLRYVASGISSSRSRRFAASSLRLLRAAVARAAR